MLCELLVMLGEPLRWLDGSSLAYQLPLMAIDLIAVDYSSLQRSN